MISKKPIFCGVATALITPFKNGRVDYPTLKKLINIQIDGGADAIVIMGTTGEPPTLTYYEYEKIADYSSQTVNGRIPLILGAGSNSTKIAVKKGLIAKKYGANATLMVTPYYNKCNDTGLYKHYESISDNTDVPIILYNVPSRTGVNITPEQALRLSEIKNVVGIKQAAPLSQTYETIKLLKGKIATYSGDDFNNLSVYKLGGKGAISVTGNLFIKEVKSVYDNYVNNKYDLAENMQKLLTPLNKALFIDVNPIPVKAGASYLGLIQNELRLPLTKISDNYYEILTDIIDELKRNL